MRTFSTTLGSSLGIILLSIGLHQCSAEKTIQYFDESDEIVVLEYGESKRGIISHLTIGYNRNISDSRCPIDLQCFWEGMAEIEIWIQPEDEEIHFLTLPIYGHVTRTDTFRHVTLDTLGYTLALLELNPYPVYENAFSEGEYEAVIYISTENGEK